MPNRLAVQQLGIHGPYNLSLDWGKLHFYRGKMKEVLIVERGVGRLLVGFGVLLAGLWLVQNVLTGFSQASQMLFGKSLIGLLPWIGCLLVMLGSFLLRDRKSFLFNLEGRNLRELLGDARTKDIELYNQLSLEARLVFDDLYAVEDSLYLHELSKQLLATAQVRTMLQRLGADEQKISASILAASNIGHVPFNHFAQWLFASSFAKAIQLEVPEIDLTTLFLVLADGPWKQMLLQSGVLANELTALQLWVRNEYRKQNYRKLWQLKSLVKPIGNVNRAYTSRYTPTLIQYSQDFTRDAALGNFTTSIGKEDQMFELIKVLQRQAGAVLIIGEPGVGKTQFLRHLAVRMVVEDVPKQLQDMRLMVFNFNKAFAENQQFEQFKLLLQTALEEAAKTNNIILVLDDIDQLINIRADYQSETINLLASAVDKLKLRIIGTTTNEGYNRHIKPQRSLASTFTPVVLVEPKPEISLQILIDVAGDLQKKYGVKPQVDALRQIVDLAPKYAYERVMPDKAIDLLDEAMITAREKGLQYLTGDLVSELVSKKLGVKVGALSDSEKQVLLKLEDKMHQRVVGQDQAVTAIAAALKRARAGLKQGSKPIASFLFFGPTGVGKTEVAKTLAEAYYGDEKLMTRVDMSEFQEEQNISRLIGQNEGTKFVGGFLTEAVRSRPFSLVLLDEIEKANPKVLDLFLQILDEGFITDGAGRKVDFANTIIIATSNAGSREIANLVSEGQKYDAVYSQVTPLLRQVFRVEFLNRFDKLIMFKPLLPLEVQQIAALELDKLAKTLEEKGLSLKYEPKLLEELVRVGYNPIYGAREIKRVIQENIEDTIAEQVVKGELSSGKTIKFSTIADYQIL